MNGRVGVLVGVLMVLVLGATTAWAEGTGLAYPVAWDNGPVYYPGPVSYGTVTTAQYTTSVPPSLTPTYAPAPVALPRAPTGCAYPPLAPVHAYRPPVAVQAKSCCLFRAPASAWCAPAQTVYRPATFAGYDAPIAPAPAAVATGPRVIVRPKVVWVEGQPVRNFFRAILP